MKMHTYKITYRHKEGDGMLKGVQTGRPSGTYTSLMHGHPNAKDAVDTWEATHRHGDNLETVEEVSA